MDKLRLSTQIGWNLIAKLGPFHSFCSPGLEVGHCCFLRFGCSTQFNYFLSHWTTSPSYCDCCWSSPNISFPCHWSFAEQRSRATSWRRLPSTPPIRQQKMQKKYKNLKLRTQETNEDSKKLLRPQDFLQILAKLILMSFSLDPELVRWTVKEEGPFIGFQKFQIIYSQSMWDEDKKLKSLIR